MDIQEQAAHKISKHLWSYISAYARWAMDQQHYIGQVISCLKDENMSTKTFSNPSVEETIKFWFFDVSVLL